jgi:hypothetical protein
VIASALHRHFIVQHAHEHVAEAPRDSGGSNWLRYGRFRGVGHL